MKLNRLFVLALLIVSCKKSSAPEFITPTEKPIIEAVYASGNIYPKNEYKLFASVAGTIMQQLASEGDVVKRNQLLFTIENVSQQARTEAASVIYKQSQANASNNSPIIKELENQVEILHRKQQNDLLNLNRQKELWAENATTKLALDNADLQYQTTTDQLKAAQYSVQKVKNQLNIEVENAQSNFKINNREVENYRIRAFGDGIIYEILKKQGEQVHPGEIVALMGDAKNNYLQLAVDETDFMKIQIGQKALIKLDLNEGKVYEATITKKYPKLNRQDQTFRVDAEFVGDNPGAFYGITLEANIVTSQKTKALTIPKSYLIGGDSLLIDDNGTERKVKIKKGIENLDEVEIVSGINKNTKILVPEK